MRPLGFALFVCLLPCAVAKADNIIAANCAVTPALCADRPSASGALSLIATDYRGYVDDSYDSGTVTSATHALYDSTYRTTVASSLTVGYDGIHGSSSMLPGGTGGGIARFNGQIIDYFQVAGSVPAGAQLKVTYGADILSDTSTDRHSVFMVSLALNGVTCLSGYHYGDLTGGCTAYIPISPTDHTARLVLNFGTELDGSMQTSAFLNATNTAKFDAITVVDAAGHPLSGVQLYDASGYNYDAAVSPLTTPGYPPSFSFCSPQVWPR